MILSDTPTTKLFGIKRTILTTLLALVTPFLIQCGDSSGFAGSSGKHKDFRGDESSKETYSGEESLATENRISSQNSKTSDAQEASEAPQHAIRKGSFAAWTEPKNPQNRQDYTINIEVRLPSQTGSYSLGDVEGTVRGSDYYVRNFGTWDLTDGDSLPSRLRTSFNIKGTKAVIRVPIPGGARYVRDVIRVKSSLLQESQELELKFGSSR